MSTSVVLLDMILLVLNLIHCATIAHGCQPPTEDLVLQPHMLVVLSDDFVCSPLSRI